MAKKFGVIKNYNPEQELKRQEKERQKAEEEPRSAWDWFKGLGKQRQRVAEQIKDKSQEVAKRFPKAKDVAQQTQQEVDTVVAKDKAQKGRVMAGIEKVGQGFKTTTEKAKERFKQTQEYEEVLELKQGLEKAGHYAKVTGEIIKNHWYSKDIRSQFLKTIPSIIATRLGVRAPIIAGEMLVQSRTAKTQREGINLALSDLAQSLNPQAKEEKRSRQGTITNDLETLQRKIDQGETLSKHEEAQRSHLIKRARELELAPGVLDSIRVLNRRLKELEQAQGLRTKQLEGKKLKYKVEELELLQNDLTENQGITPEERTQKEQEINNLLAQENLKPTPDFSQDQALEILKERLKQNPEARSQERSSEMKQLRKDLARILESYRRQHGQIDSEEAQDVAKIIKQDIQTKVRGMDVARESLNSALVAGTGLAAAGTAGLGAVPAYATMRLARLGGYAFLGRVGRGLEEYQKLSKEEVLNRIIQKSAEAKRQAGAGAVALEEFSPEKRKLLEKIGLSFKAATLDSAKEFFNAIRAKGRKQGSSSLQKGLDLSRALAVLGRYGFMAYGIGLRGEKISDSVQFRQTFDKIIDQMAEKGFKGSTAAAGKSFVDNAADTLRLMSYSAKGLGKMFSPEAEAVGAGESPAGLLALEKSFSVSSEDGLSSEEFKKVADTYSNIFNSDKTRAAQLLQIWKSQGKVSSDLWETIPEGQRTHLESAAVPPSSTELPQQTLELASSQKESPELLMEYDSQLSDATVHKGEGIEHALIRQLRAEPGEFGFKGDASDSAAVKEWAQGEAHRIALRHHYAGDEKGEVWVKEPDRVAYILNQDKTVSEYDLTEQKITETGAEGEELEPYEMRKPIPKFKPKSESPPAPTPELTPEQPIESPVIPIDEEVLKSRLTESLQTGLKKFKNPVLAENIKNYYTQDKLVEFMTAQAPKDVKHFEDLTSTSAMIESPGVFSENQEAVRNFEELQKELIQTWTREHGVNSEIFNQVNFQEQQSIIRALDRAKNLEDKEALRDLLSNLNEKYKNDKGEVLIPKESQQVSRIFGLKTEPLPVVSPAASEPFLLKTQEPTKYPEDESMDEYLPKPPVDLDKSARTQKEIEAALAEKQKIMEGPLGPGPDLREEEVIPIPVPTEIEGGKTQLGAEGYETRPLKEQITPIEGGEVRMVEEGIAETTPPEKGEAGTPESVTIPESTETPEKLEEVVESAPAPIDIEEGTTRVEEGITTTEPQRSQVTPIKAGESEVLEVETATTPKEEPAIIESRDYPSVAKQEVAPKPEEALPESEKAAKTQSSEISEEPKPEIRGTVDAKEQEEFERGFNKVSVSEELATTRARANKAPTKSNIQEYKRELEEYKDYIKKLPKDRQKYLAGAISPREEEIYSLEHPAEIRGIRVPRGGYAEFFIPKDAKGGVYHYDERGNLTDALRDGRALIIYNKDGYVENVVMDPRPSNLLKRGEKLPQEYFEEKPFDRVKDWKTDGVGQDLLESGLQIRDYQELYQQLISASRQEEAAVMLGKIDKIITSTEDRYGDAVFRENVLDQIKNPTAKTEVIIDQPDVKGKIETTKRVTEEDGIKETVERETLKGDVFGTSKTSNELKQVLLKGIKSGKLKEDDFLKQIEEYQGGKMSRNDIKRAHYRYQSLIQDSKDEEVLNLDLDILLRTLDLKRAAGLEIPKDAPNLLAPETVLVPNAADWVSELGGLNGADEKRFLTFLDTTLSQGELKGLGVEPSVLEELKDNDFNMLKARRVHLQALEKLRPALEQTVRSGQGGQETLKTLDKITNHLRKFVGSGNPIEQPGEIAR